MERLAAAFCEANNNHKFSLFNDDRANSQRVTCKFGRNRISFCHIIGVFKSVVDIAESMQVNLGQESYRGCVPRSIFYLCKITFRHSCEFPISDNRFPNIREKSLRSRYHDSPFRTHGNLATRSRTPNRPSSERPPRARGRGELLQALTRGRTDDTSPYRSRRTHIDERFVRQQILASPGGARTMEKATKVLEQPNSAGLSTRRFAERLWLSSLSFRSLSPARALCCPSK